MTLHAVYLLVLVQRGGEQPHEPAPGNLTLSIDC